jgi:hypothetical protein
VATAKPKKKPSDTAQDTKLFNKLAATATVAHANTATTATTATTANTANVANTANSATTASTAANATALGGLPPAASQSRVPWALVQATGAIIDQSGGISTVRIAAGEYYVNFGVPISGRALMTSPWLHQGLEDGDTDVQAEACGTAPVDGASCNASIDPTVNNGNQALVETTTEVPWPTRRSTSP